VQCRLGTPEPCDFRSEATYVSAWSSVIAALWNRDVAVTLAKLVSALENVLRAEALAGSILREQTGPFERRSLSTVRPLRPEGPCPP
jgi:hypothetical protein